MIQGRSHNIAYLVYTYVYYLYYCGISEEHILSEVIWSLARSAIEEGFSFLDLRFSHWKQSDASPLAVSVAKIVYLIHQNAWVPYGVKSGGTGVNLLGTLIQNEWSKSNPFSN